MLWSPSSRGARSSWRHGQPVTPDTVLAYLADSGALRDQQIEVIDGLADSQHLVHQVEFAEFALA
jgi:hypothetical protein